MRNTNLHLFTFLFLISFFNSIGHSQENLDDIAHLNLNFGNGYGIKEMFKDKNLLFALTANNIYKENTSVGIFDLSEPKSPVELGRKIGNDYRGIPEYDKIIQYIEDAKLPSLCYAISSSSDNEILHYFWYPQKVAMIDDIIYEFRDYKQELNIYKIIGPTNFELIKTYTLNTHLSEISGIEVRDKVIYISTRFAGIYSGLILLDVSNIDSLTELESPITNKDLTGLTLGDNILLVGDNFTNISVLDVSNPRNPVYQYNRSLFHNRLKGCWQNDRFYLNGLTDLISIFDNDVNLKQDIPTIGKVSSFIIDNNYLIAASKIGIEIYNIADENLPVIETVYGANISRPVKFTKKNDLLYFAILGDGVKIVDISDKFQPELIGEYDLNGYATDIAVLDEYIYIADYILGLVILDGSNPQDPVIESILPINTALSIDIRENKAFVLTDKNEVYVIDTNNKQKPIVEYTKSFPYGGRFGAKCYDCYKKILVSNDDIWIKFYDSFLYAYQYFEDEGLIEKFKYDYNMSSAPNELQLIDNKIFLIALSGIQIIDPENYSFIKEEFFGITHMEEYINAAAFNSNEKLLYVSKNTGIDIYDLTKPEQPVQLETCIQLGFQTIEIIYDNGFIYNMSPQGISIHQLSSINNIITKNIVPDKYGFISSYPNPFNAFTKILISLPINSRIKIEIFNCLGEKVRVLDNEIQTSGEKTVVWDGKNNFGENVPSGIYFCHLASNISKNRMLKILLLK